ncbi:MAG: DUF47 domain-containing protein, partial [Collinsella intestinalis]
KKNDAFYFDSFASAAELASKAAQKLDEIMPDFDPAKIEEAVAEMHAIEQEADEIVHDVNDALISAFITPIEREDIATLAGAIDVVVDRIEGVLHRIYFTNIKRCAPARLRCRPRSCAPRSRCTISCSSSSVQALQSLREHVITVNTIEQCDDIYIAAMRELHTGDFDR